MDPPKVLLKRGDARKMPIVVAGASQGNSRAASPRPPIASLRRLTERLEDRFQLRAHRETQGAPRRQLAQEPLVVEPREIAVLGQPLEGAFHERIEGGVVFAIHDPVGIVGEEFVEDREASRIARFGRRCGEHGVVAGPRVRLAGRDGIESLSVAGNDGERDPQPLALRERLDRRFVGARRGDRDGASVQVTVRPDARAGTTGSRCRDRTGP